MDWPMHGAWSADTACREATVTLWPVITPLSLCRGSGGQAGSQLIGSATGRSQGRLRASQCPRVLSVSRGGGAAGRLTVQAPRLFKFKGEGCGVARTPHVSWRAEEIFIGSHNTDLPMTQINVKSKGW